MSGIEFFARGIAAGACIGMPAYVLGQLTYNGKLIPKALFAMTGCIAGVAAGVIVLAGHGRSPEAVIVVSLLVGALGGATFAGVPNAQRWFRSKAER